MFKLTQLAIATVIASTVSVSASAINIGNDSEATKMIVGDSIFALSGDIHANLENDLNESIDTYAKVGCQMNGGNFICLSFNAVPKQYAKADKSGISTVIMNGGGNDFLLGDGADCTTEACVDEVLYAIEETFSGLVSDMKSDGIQEIVYLGYYYLQDNDANNAVNYKSMSYKMANYPAMGVKFVDSRDAFLGNEASYITSDGIHPTATGSRVLADLILQALD